MDILLILAGFAGLLVGGELLVGSSVGLARRLGVPPLVIGLTLVGFGTSAPELVTSLQAALAGAPGIALGNVVGSNIANILLILGTAALLRPIAVASGAFRRDGTVLIAATAACAALALLDTIGRAAGIALVLALAAYLVFTLRNGRDPSAAVYEAEADYAPAAGRPSWQLALLFAAGLGATLLGARALVAGATALARDLGVSEAVIGLTIVAIGTSLPELATSITAARKGEADVAFGNVVGSNIFNILGILGTTAIVAPLAVDPRIAAIDVWVMAAATLALVAVATTGWRIRRSEGAALLALYIGYLAALALF